MKKIIFYFIFFTFVFNQDYNGPSDQAGDPSAIKEARMDGNRILLYFKNTTQLSNWEPPNGLYDVSIWPNDGTGYRMLDGVALLVGGKTYIHDDDNDKTLDTQIVDNENDIQSYGLNNSLHTLYFLQTSYREEMDHDELEELKKKKVKFVNNTSDEILSFAIEAEKRVSQLWKQDSEFKDCSKKFSNEISKSPVIKGQYYNNLIGQEFLRYTQIN